MLMPHNEVAGQHLHKGNEMEGQAWGAFGNYDPTQWYIFIAIVLGYLAVIVFVLGGRKVFFAPYVDKEDK